jgi:hypothetical protein
MVPEVDIRTNLTTLFRSEKEQMAQTSHPPPPPQPNPTADGWKDVVRAPGEADL